MTSTAKFLVALSAILNLTLVAILWRALPEKPKPTIIQCESKDALPGMGFTIDLKQPLAAQGCNYHEDMPGKLLCDRKVTLECDLP